MMKCLRPLFLSLIAATSAWSVQRDVSGPADSSAFGGGVTVLPNGNIVVADPEYSSPEGAQEVGAVYLYTAAGAPVSKLTGESPYDRIGSRIVVLSTGHYLIVSSEWDNGAEVDAGAVTWASGTSGVSGTVSEVNSLIGSHAGDDVGDEIVRLETGHYLVCSPGWDNGSAVNAGAVTWGSGETGVGGVITSTNSLLGSSAEDRVGERIVPLTAGNFLVVSPAWNRGAIVDAGAVTWGSGASGVQGFITETNSLVGRSAGDKVAADYTRGVRVLSTGDYVLCSPDFTATGGAALAGAITWCHGTGSTVGQVTENNSFIGQASDRLGSEGAQDLGQGRYVVASPQCNSGSVQKVGAVTWFAGGGSATGTVSSTNSLIGERLNDQVGSGGIFVLTGGQYVISSPEWDSGSVSNAGAVTWCSGSTGRTGLVAVGNSLTGSSASDGVGEVVPLSNGHYVVATPDWDNGSAADAGAVTWCNGTQVTAAVVSTANSLTGSQTSDSVGWGIYPLSNGHYVVQSLFWNNAAVLGAGAVTWCSGTASTSASVSAANSLVGSHASDGVGYITPLSNGHYLVTSPEWDHGSVENAGAVTWCNGSSATSGSLSTGNSLVGSRSFDALGNRVITLANDNYLVTSDHANQSSGSGILEETGAVTFGSGSTGVKGTVSAANSLIGTHAGDNVGTGMGGGIVKLADGHYLVASDAWNSVGSVTWCNGTTGRTGAVSAANSLTGKSDLPLGNSDTDVTAWIKPQSDSSYILTSYYSGSQNGFALSMALTHGVAGGTSVGAIAAANSYFDTGVGFGDGMLVSDYDAARKQVVIGSPKRNKITLARFGTAAGTAPSITASTADLAADATTLIITGNNFSAYAPDNVITFNNGVTGSITAATATQLTITQLTGLTAGPLQASVRSGLSADSPSVQVARVLPLLTASTATLTAGSPLIVQGRGFSTTPANNVLTFSNGITGTVTAATATQLTVTLFNAVSGPLTASVKVNGVNAAGASVTVATLIPAVTERSVNIGLGSSTLLILGQGFSPTHTNNSVTLSGGATGTVTSATTTQLTVTGLTGLQPGALTAVVTVNGQSSGAPVQVAQVISDASGTIAFDQSVYAVDQDATSVTLTLVRGETVTATAVSIHTANGTASTVPPFSPALAGTDYTALSGPGTLVSFAQGDTSKTVVIPITPNTKTTTPNKRFTVTLSDPVGGSSLGAIPSTQVQILAFDTKIPTLTLTAPAATVSAALPFLLKGTAGDTRGIQRVEVYLNGAETPQYATIETAKSPTSVPFSLGIFPMAGTTANTVRVRAFDFQGNFQDVVRSFKFTRRYRLTLARTVPSSMTGQADKVGTVTLAATPASAASALTPTTANATPKTSDIVPGSPVKLTAVGKTGYAFSHWDGLPGDAVDQGSVVTFAMPVDADLAVTAHFMVNPFAGQAGYGTGTVFYGLLQADEGTPSTNETEGALTATMTATTGALSGQVLIGGLAQKFTATVRGDGQVFFTVGKVKQPSLPFGDRTLYLTYNALTFQNALTASLSAPSGPSSGFALRALYDGKINKVPSGLLNSTTKGFYTLAFPAKLHPTLPAAAYPQGTGFATVSLTNAGLATYAFTFPDGSIATASSALTLSDRSPVFLQQVTPGAKSTVKGGSFGGVFQFTAGTGNNVTATDLLWFRPAAVNTDPRPYTLGWPEGITVDAWGSLYDVKRTAQATLALPLDNPTTGNAHLGFLLGRLTNPVNLAAFNIKGSNVIKIPATDKTYTLILAAAKGTFSGTFTPDWALPKSLPTFKGVLIQQGPRQGGHGFFLSNIVGDPYPESGVVKLGPPME